MVITLGGGVDVPVIPGRKYEDWELRDPAGKDVGAARVLRDDIKARVQSLVSGLLPALHPDAS
jgi:arsenate reductase